MFFRAGTKQANHRTKHRADHRADHRTKQADHRRPTLIRGKPGLPGKGTEVGS